jgi:signal transduction histidine kinase/CheY-like chemotaxis protein
LSYEDKKEAPSTMAALTIMNKKKMIGIVVLFTCVLLGFRLLWVHHHLTLDYPFAKDGILDLRGVELQDHQPFTLNGEWLFYREQLIDPQKMEEPLSDLRPTEITVPSGWREIVSEDDRLHYGYGTYRLRILLAGQSEPYTLNFKEIRSSATVFVNGKKVAEMGRVGETAESAIPDYRPFEVTIDGNLQEIDLVIQFSNFHTSRSAGIAKSILFGTSTAVNKAQTQSFMMQFVVVTILLLHCIYAFVIFLAFVRKKELVYLSLAFLSAALSVLVDDDKILLYLLPAISWETWIKLLYISYASSAFFMLQFSKSLMMRNSNGTTRLFTLFKVINLIYLLYIVCVLIDLKVIITPLFTVIMVLIPLMVPLVILRLVEISGKTGVIYLLLATISIASSAIWGAIKSRVYTSFPYYSFDIIVGVIFFAVFWFKRFNEATNESKDLTAKLQKEMQRKDDFLANTSHELRNPLHGIMNISQTIYDTEKDKLDEENKRSLEILMTVGRRMSMTLNDLLDMTKLKNDGIRLQMKDVDITSVASSVFDMLHFMREGKKISFVHTIPESFPLVKADENRLFQILFNLVHNAVKYTNEGEITVSAEMKQGMAFIHVKDHGIGMDAETVEKAFQPYEQADSEMTAIVGGIGLGLSICDQLVKLHGGTISVNSSIGQGSTFTFTLPVVEHQQAKSSSKPKRVHDAEPVKVKRKPEIYLDEELPRLLVVDDDPLNLAIVERMLQAEHYHVITCISGQEALRLLEKKKWDLVISDVMMPQMSGYELTRTIRERFTLSELPILLLTARSQVEDIQTGFLSGANDYVTKPVEKLELITRVRALIDLKVSIHEKVRLEAAWLQAQIRPHFLFNTLNTIMALSELNPPKMLELLDEFGNYLYASFATQNLNQSIPLEKELELVRSYVFIEQQRFGYRLNIEWEVEKIPDAQVPPLAIQTLVENAVNHGVLKRPDGGTVCIRIIEQRQSIEVSIIDDGVGISEEKLNRLLTHPIEGQQGIGLLNTNKRLRQQYGHGLVITSTPDVGTTIIFTIPTDRKASI